MEEDCLLNMSFDNREGYIWYNGKVVDWKTANIHVLNHGLHYASCVFEGERAYKGKYLKLNNIQTGYLIQLYHWI